LAAIYTVGHSTRTLDELIAALQAHEIGVLADIRAYPASRRMPYFQGPQFPPFMTREEGEQQEALETTLPRAGIEYRWLRELGGRRKKIRDDSPNLALRSPTFRNYADYMMTPEFEAAIGALLQLAAIKRTCIMCSERQVYWHCHRMLVSDYLALHGHEVLHIDNEKPAKPHRITAEASFVEGQVIYPGLFT
jgi:uncharacterized protein (DUF488 family)